MILDLESSPMSSSTRNLKLLLPSNASISGAALSLYVSTPLEWNFCDGRALPGTVNSCGRRTSRLDVRIGGGRASWKNGRSKGGCVNFIVLMGEEGVKKSEIFADIISGRSVSLRVTS